MTRRTSEAAAVTQSHMLDGCDPDECYKTMMSERTDLIKARREAEDNLVKTIVQLSATLIVLLAGFLTQTSVRIYSGNSWMLAVVVLLLIFSLVAGLSEHIFSSKAYLAQQILVEKFYNKEINDFSEPSANRWVRRFQVSAFIFFVGSLSILGFFAFSQMRDKIYEQATATATATAPAPAPAAPAAAPAYAIQRSSIDTLSRPSDASASTKEGVKK